MNEIIRAIHSRRSIRGFENRPVPMEITQQIVECGRCAPNAWNRQSFSFHVITDRKVLHALAAVTASHLGGIPEDHCFFDAPLVILVTDLRENFMRLADAGCAMENMFLAAHSCGVGSVWINQLSSLGDKPDLVVLLESVGIPKDRVVTSIGAFGYPAQAPKPKELVSKVYYINQEETL